MGAEVRSSNEGSTKATLSRDEVRHLISLGHVLVLHRRSVYRLNNWLSRHPGGHLAILHFVGRDASNEIEAYHCKDTIERVMRHYIIAQVKSEDFSDEVGWKPLTPLVQLSKEGAFGRVERKEHHVIGSRIWNNGEQGRHKLLQVWCIQKSLNRLSRQLRSTQHSSTRYHGPGRHCTKSLKTRVCTTVALSGVIEWSLSDISVSSLHSFMFSLMRAGPVSDGERSESSICLARPFEAY
jgi:hypothetical protein